MTTPTTTWASAAACEGPRTRSPDLRWTRGLWLLAALAVGCGEDLPRIEARAWPEADRLFLSDDLWRGGDGALSVDLGGGRVLWLFGDSFVARPEVTGGGGDAFLRNSVAIQTGYDPSRAFMQFFWRRDEGGPRSFFPELEDAWLWPGHGARIGDTLAIFLGELRGEDAGLGYAGAGWRVVLIRNPDDDPPAWAPEPARTPESSFGIDVGASVLVDGGFLYAYGQRGDQTHVVYVLRWPVGDVVSGDLSDPAWWDGGDWVRQSALPGEPAPILDDGASELSVHWEPAAGRLLQLQSVGFGGTTLGGRWADRPEGPWSSLDEFYRPIESFAVNAFVYAGKGHPELHGADVVMTYVPSLFPEESADLGFDPRLYHPHFVRLTITPP